ncbi:MAG: sugar ABC transporter permease [Eubacteriales bacterium]|nr:sugar ABC transporter permease [Eubacteriales bacterium]
MPRLHKKKPSLERQNIGYLFVLPSGVIYLVFIIIPVIWTAVMSMTDYNLTTSSFVGLHNYATMLYDRVFQKALWNTVRYTLLTLLPSLAIGLALALLINRKFLGRGLFRAVFYMPHILSLVVASLAWNYIFSEVGILNQLIRGLGGARISWLTNPNLSMFCIVVASLWMVCGHYMILFLSGLQAIPEYLYEAASIDGANAWVKFFRVTLPMLAPTTFFVFITACINSFQVFGQVYIMTGGGPGNTTTTLAHQIYLNAFQYGKMGYASAIAVVLMVIILIITAINYRFGNGKE